MASLRNIMNVEDDHSDPPHTMASSRESASMSRNTPPNVSRSYQMPPELSMNPTSGAGVYRGPSGYSSHHQDPESSHQGNMLASPARSTTESVDYTYAQSPTYGQSQGYSTSGMRQLAPGPNPGDVPVKLTPVTGRVSRAKKGVPVHICEMCRPPKTFTRAEHLRRHQLSHQPPDLRCPVPGCNKVFHRKDLLDRHQQRHEQDDRLGNAPRRSYGNSSMSPIAGCNGSSPSRTLSSSHGDPSPSPTTAGGFASQMNSASGSGSWSPSTGTVMGSPKSMTPRMQDDQSRFRMNAGLSHYAQSLAALHNPTVPRTYASDITPSSSNNSNVDTDQGLQVSTLWQTNNNRPILSSGFPSPSLPSNQQPLSTSLMTWDGRSPNAFQSAATGTDANSRVGFNTAGSFGGYVTPRQTISVPYAGFSQDPSGGGVTQSRDTVRSLPLPLPAGLPSETPLTPPATLPSEVTMNASASAPQSRLSATPSPMTLRQGVRESMPNYLEAFWSGVAPDYPVIHRSTFEAECQLNTEVIDILCCSMAAVGTQFLHHADDRNNGGQLHVYVGHKLKQMTQADQWPLWLMYAVLFWEYYGRFRGREKDSYRGSAMFATMYQMIANSVPQMLPENSTCTTHKEWIQEESKRRLLSACFILDSHSVRYFEQEPTSINGIDLSNPTKMPLYLISSTTPLWEATEAQWNSLYQHQPPPCTAGWVIEHGLEAAHLAAASFFDCCLFLLTQSIQLLPRASATRVDLVPSCSEIDIDKIQIPALFTDTATAHAYMALHYTPLHVVLSVSGDSWVFNKKVLRPSSFTQHQKQLAIWRDSANAVVAVAFAARALRILLDLDQQPSYQRGAAAGTHSAGGNAHKNISDFWGIYVCALICWAFGHTGRNAADLRGSTREAAMQWVKQASRMAPTQIMSLAGRSHAQGVIGLAKEVLEQECLGGRSILLADAVGVLRKLDEGGNCVRF